MLNKLKSLRNNQGFMKYFQNTSWLLGEKILRMFVEAVGQYAVAVKLSAIWYFIPVTISASLFPAIINAKKQNEKLYNEGLQKLYDMMAWLAIAITTLIAQFIASYFFNLFNKKLRHTFLLQTNAILLPFRKLGVKFE